MPALAARSTDEIAEVLRGEILDQRYREGDRLPSERAMAARFNASRGAIKAGLFAARATRNHFQFCRAACTLGNQLD